MRSFEVCVCLSCVGAAIDAIKAATRKEKRELEAHEADQRKRMQSLSRDFSRESNKVATTRTANTAASTTGKGITRNKSKGVTMSYASAVYKALTRGERNDAPRGSRVSGEV